MCHAACASMSIAAPLPPLGRLAPEKQIMWHIEQLKHQTYVQMLCNVSLRRQLVMAVFNGPITSANYSIFQLVNPLSLFFFNSQVFSSMRRKLILIHISEFFSVQQKSVKRK